MNRVDIVFITDNDYIIPTLTAALSAKQNRKQNTFLTIHVVSTDQSQKNDKLFFALADDRTCIDVIHASAEKYKELHVYRESSPCVATTTALLKFDLPFILNDLEKVLYLDGDIIVRKDLWELFSTDISGMYLAAVVDSGSLYYKHPYVVKLDRYFNSGMMLLNLALLREEKVPTALLDAKIKNEDSLFMDQDAFNVVCQNRTVFLPLKFNFLYASLIRATGKYAITDINDMYGTNYNSLDQIQNDAVLIHYSSKDKPWKVKGVPLGEEWYYYYLQLNLGEEIIDESKVNTRGQPKVSIIVPVYNSGQWLQDSLDSLVSQTFSDFEIICINDGSTDQSLEIIKRFANRDSRIRVINQPNKGQSAARNIGIQKARGEYLYFFDSDDLLVKNAVELMYEKASLETLDVLLFNGVAYYESEELEKKYPIYNTYYSRKGDYLGIYDGQSIYVKLVDNQDYIVSPCLFFFSREYLLRTELTFYDGIIYEDNLFALKALLGADRVGYFPKTLFKRRVREGSTITGKVSFYNFRSYLICIMHMYKYCLSKDFSDSVIDRVSTQIDILSKRAFEVYEGLEDYDKRRPWISNSNEKLFLNLVYDNVMSNKENIRNKTGNMTLKEFFKLKLKGGIQCLKDNGIIYTINRVGVHLGLRKE